MSPSDKPAESVEAFANAQKIAMFAEADEFIEYAKRLGFGDDRIFGEALQRVLSRRLTDSRAEALKHWGSNEVDAAFPPVPREGLPKWIDKLVAWMKQNAPQPAH